MIYFLFKILKKVNSEKPDKILFERSNSLYLYFMMLIIQGLFFLSYKVFFSKYTNLEYMDLMYGFSFVCVLLFIYEDLVRKRKQKKYRNVLKKYLLESKMT